MALVMTLVMTLVTMLVKTLVMTMVRLLMIAISEHKRVISAMSMFDKRSLLGRHMSLNKS